MVDDRTRRVRREDVQYTPLPESMQWLNELSDDEYNAYWDEVDARCGARFCYWDEVDAGCGVRV